MRACEGQPAASFPGHCLPHPTPVCARAANQPPQHRVQVYDGTDVMTHCDFDLLYLKAFNKLLSDG